MMHVVYFSLKEQFLSEVKKIAGDKIFVTPSPAKADSLRTILDSDDSEDVITIAKFISLFVEMLWDPSERPQLKRKSELLLIFGILRNKYLPELSYEQFIHAYNLFSDLRSFSLNLDSLSSVLDEFPEVMKKTLTLFWKLLDLTGHIDEHGAYQMIGDRLRTCPEILGKDKTYIFWGFQHLNAQQIDLLKILSTSCDLIIPIPSTIRASEKRSDWISWIKDFNTKIEELPLIVCQPKASWIPINTREISRSLKSLIQDGDQVLLGVSKLSPSHMNIIPWKNVFFKVPLEILSDELSQLHSEIEKFRGTLADLSSFLDLKIQSTLNLKVLRAIQLYKESLSFVLEMTDETIVIDSFFVKLLSDVTKLNQPRTSFIPISSEKTLVELKDMSSLEDIDLKRRVILCIDDRFDGMQSSGQNYTESIQKTLSSVGPIKRSDLDFLFKEWELKNL
ncbi:MAG: hypothetical protein EBU93_06475, partial [Chlamydiae bacterium]|nr:hypothetical protein [Chlamydiota bacterium]